MKVLMLSSSLEGGGGGMTYRLLQGLRRLGVDCRALVQDNIVGRADPNVIRARTGLLRHAVNRVRMRLHIDPLRRYPKQEPMRFSVQRYPDSLAGQVAALKPDLIHLHWICNDWMSVSTLGRFTRPVIWTCHDMWPFTGGCHHSGACDRYTGQCGRCPVLHSDSDNDLSHRVWQRKARALRGSNFTLVCPSKWMAERARTSSLFGNSRVEVIPNGISLQNFRPLNRRAARDVLGLPPDKRIIVFGAWRTAPHKGPHLLAAALRRLSEEGWRDRLELVLFTFHKPADGLDFCLRTHYLGRLYDPVSMALAYSAGDVVVIPSIHENLPTMAIEAGACATPCVGFRTGGLPDIIEHRRNGYLAEPYDPAELARGIAWVLEDESRRQRLARRGREKAEEEFSIEHCTRRYLSLYTELCPGLETPVLGVTPGSHDSGDDIHIRTGMDYCAAR